VSYERLGRRRFFTILSLLMTRSSETLDTGRQLRILYSISRFRRPNIWDSNVSGFRNCHIFIGPSRRFVPFNPNWRQFASTLYIEGPGAGRFFIIVFFFLFFGVNTRTVNTSQCTAIVLGTQIGFTNLTCHVILKYTACHLCPYWGVKSNWS